MKRSRNQLESHLLKDQEEDLKEAKTRVPLKQLRRKQKPLEKNDPEAGPENGMNLSKSLCSIQRKGGSQGLLCKPQQVVQKKPAQEETEETEETSSQESAEED
ncbi:PREDICTED: high mobility group protein HMGI-C [Gavialis gangeticus]|uniref:high mobility group protein HMGI-C n=1 Tax=Gavialis gangeticus TaxID=94835 RepID=UPI000907434D|nr:high mobility group protein HMGI-C isoform X2 [Alligator mississippiensis]XP_019370220.1 PREDICTED: high mobility group protein HMGI-C [Gavialis gangeticus]